MTENGLKYKQQFDKSAKLHDFKIGDLILFSEHNFLGKNKKLAPKWLGPATIVDITETNVKIKCQNGKVKLLNVARIKHFILESSKLKTGVQPELEEFTEPDQQFVPKIPNEIFNKPPQRIVTRSLSRLLQEQHTINFVEVDLRHKLAIIADKLYLQQIPFQQLSAEDQTLWSSFSVEDIMFFLTNQREHTPDPNTYAYLFPQKQRPQQQQPPQPPPLPQVATPPIRPNPWPKHHMTVDPRNIIATPFQRLTRASANRWRHLDH